ncbi:MAG: hypothetical protein BWY46_00374 [Firmicutes bacterium ADurb.Bin300]|jgi:hypothetical protein|nr:MAG: hypothetical protein BWY46_00374 [Firmicutes bacterium ADurb.Bin300]
MRFDLHVHTAENDIVVTKDAPEIVKMYHEKGYEGLVITNHFFSLSLEWYRDILRGASHEKMIDHYLKGYRNAKITGDALGMVVLLGTELRFDNTSNDYLVFGIDEDFLYNAPMLNTLTLDKFLKIMPENSLIYQAHPFRNNMTITKPEKLFGIEVYNGGTPKDRNEFARMWADMHNLRKISGSDYHLPKHLARGGVDFFNRVETNDELVAQLRSGRYTLIEFGKGAAND